MHREVRRGEERFNREATKKVRNERSAAAIGRDPKGGQKRRDRTRQ